MLLVILIYIICSGCMLIATLFTSLFVKFFFSIDRIQMPFIIHLSGFIHVRDFLVYIP